MAETAAPTPEPSFRINDCVLAVYSGYPVWPGVIKPSHKRNFRGKSSAVLTVHGRSDLHYWVHFPDEDNGGWVRHDLVVRYHPRLADLVRRRSRGAYRTKQRYALCVAKCIFETRLAGAGTHVHRRMTLPPTQREITFTKTLIHFALTSHPDYRPPAPPVPHPGAPDAVGAGTGAGAGAGGHDEADRAQLAEPDRLQRQVEDPRGGVGNNNNNFGEPNQIGLTALPFASSPQQNFRQHQCHLFHQHPENSSWTSNWSDTSTMSYTSLPAHLRVRCQILTDACNELNSGDNASNGSPANDQRNTRAAAAQPRHNQTETSAAVYDDTATPEREGDQNQGNKNKAKRGGKQGKKSQRTQPKQQPRRQRQRQQQDASYSPLAQNNSLFNSNTQPSTARTSRDEVNLDPEGTRDGLEDCEGDHNNNSSLSSGEEDEVVMRPNSKRGRPPRRSSRDTKRRKSKSARFLPRASAPMTNGNASEGDDDFDDLNLLQSHEQRSLSTTRNAPSSPRSVQPSPPATPITPPLRPTPTQSVLRPSSMSRENQTERDAFGTDTERTESVRRQEAESDLDEYRREDEMADLGVEQHSNPVRRFSRPRRSPRQLRRRAQRQLSEVSGSAAHDMTSTADSNAPSTSVLSYTVTSGRRTRSTSADLDQVSGSQIVPSTCMFPDYREDDTSATGGGGDKSYVVVRDDGDGDENVIDEVQANLGRAIVVGENVSCDSEFMAQYGSTRDERAETSGELDEYCTQPARTTPDQSHGRWDIRNPRGSEDDKPAEAGEADARDGDGKSYGMDEYKAEYVKLDGEPEIVLVEATDNYNLGDDDAALRIDGGTLVTVDIGSAVATAVGDSRRSRPNAPVQSRYEDQHGSDRSSLRNTTVVDLTQDDD